MLRPTVLTWSVLLLGLATRDSNAQPYRLEGTVSLDGQPVAAAAVTLTCGALQVVVLTDATGGYRFDTRPPGDCTVAVKTENVSPEAQPLASTEQHLAFALTSGRGLGSWFGASSESLSLFATSPAVGAVTTGFDGFRFNSSASGRASGHEDAPRVDHFGQAWSLSTSLTYTRRNSTFVVGLHGSHGVHLPSSLPGSMGAFALGLSQPSFADVTGSRAWDARVVVKHRLFGSDRTLSADVFAEGVLPLDRGVQGLPDARLPASFRPVRSQSLRFGVVISH